MSHRVFCFAHHHHHHYPINGPGRNSFRWCREFPWREVNLKRRQGPSLSFFSALHAAPHLLSGQLVTHPPTPNKHSSAHVPGQEPKQNPPLSWGPWACAELPGYRGRRPVLSNLKGLVQQQVFTTTVESSLLNAQRKPVHDDCSYSV